MSSNWQPCIVGHRGCAGVAPENTIPAIQTAANLHLPRIEIDVRFSGDGHVVLMHDATVDRTTDGTGRVDELALEELQELDAAARWAPRFRDTRIPTLDEVFQQFGKRFHWQVEIKADSPADCDPLAKAVVERIRWHGVERATVTSAATEALRRAAYHAPEVGRALIIGENVADAVADAEACGCTTVCVRRSLLDRHTVAMVRRYGMFIVGWTGNSPEELVEFARAEVDAVSTDRPDIVLEWMRENRIRLREHA